MLYYSIRDSVKYGGYGFASLATDKHRPAEPGVRLTLD
jgi:hypothetical protein